MENYATRIKELRLEKELTQRQLSDATGISKSAIAQWETESRVPNINALIILAKFFDVSLDYLAGIKDE